VVAYSNAHFSGVESELIVHSTHSNPAKIAEVQRIQMLQLAASGTADSRSVRTCAIRMWKVEPINGSCGRVFIARRALINDSLKT
jgi:hypothetical protein